MNDEVIHSNLIVECSFREYNIKKYVLVEHPTGNLGSSENEMSPKFIWAAVLIIVVAGAWWAWKHMGQITVMISTTGTQVALPPARPEIPVQIIGVVMSAEAETGKITIEAAQDSGGVHRGTKVVGVVTKQTQFSRSVLVAENGNIFTTKPAKFSDLKQGTHIKLIPERSSIEKNFLEFTLLLVTIQSK